MTYKKITNELLKRKLAIAKERDRLLDLQGEVGELIDSLEMAEDHLQDALDALSQYV